MNASLPQTVNRNYLSSRITFNSPFNWIAHKLNPAVAEKEVETSHELARQKQAKEGKGNLFDATAAAVAETDKPTLAASVVPRRKHTEVRLHSPNYLLHSY